MKLQTVAETEVLSNQNFNVLIVACVSVCAGQSAPRVYAEPKLQ